MAWIRWHERSDGRRTAYLQWRDEAGKIRSRSVGSDPRLAKMHLRVAQRAEGKGTRREAAPLTPLALAEDYLAERALQVRGSTVRADREKLMPLVEAWKDVVLGDWDRKRLVQYVGAQNWSPRTTQMFVNVCRRFIRWAHDQDIPVPDFVGTFRGPKVRHPEAVPLTGPQLKSLLDAARDHPYLELPVALAGLAGLALGDLRDLDWSEVDLQANVISRRRSKTDERVHVPIGRTLREILERRRAVAGGVCRGLPSTNPPLNKALHKLYELAGVPAAPRGLNGFHRLRHTFGTLIKGDSATKGKALGHRPGSVMPLRYEHSDEERVQAAVRALDDTLAAS